MHELLDLMMTAIVRLIGYTLMICGGMAALLAIFFFTRFSVLDTLQLILTAVCCGGVGATLVYCWRRY